MLRTFSQKQDPFSENLTMKDRATWQKAQKLVASQSLLEFNKGMYCCPNKWFYMFENEKIDKILLTQYTNRFKCKKLADYQRSNCFYVVNESKNVFMLFFKFY
jgi:hypothetical protein